MKTQFNTGAHSQDETIETNLLDADEMIEAHFFAKRMYDPSIHADFDNTAEYERSVIVDLARNRTFV